MKRMETGNWGTRALLAALLSGALLIGPVGCGDDDGTVVDCGNGLLDVGEECDDGDDLNSDTLPDSCRTNCTLYRCGDGVQDGNEACDDGNTASGDGCSATCLVEVAGCGNGNLDPGEDCDDGNNINGDGCSEDCRSEFCGDGVLDAG
ncbi:MAG: DUF4215 domain-containing protein [bacterium]